MWSCRSPARVLLGVERMVRQDDTEFGPLLIHEDDEATVLDFNELPLPCEGEARRVKTDRIRARRRAAVRGVAVPVPARQSPARTVPVPIPVRRPTVPAHRSPRDWAQEATSISQVEVTPSQRDVGTLISPNISSVRDDTEAHALTLTSMAMSLAAGVVLAAALANLGG